MGGGGGGRWVQKGVGEVWIFSGTAQCLLDQKLENLVLFSFLVRIFPMHFFENLARKKVCQSHSQ